MNMSIFGIFAGQARPLGGAGRGLRLGVDAAVDARDEIKFPGAALDLPSPKRREQDDEQQCKREERAALRRAAVQSRPPFPPALIGIMFELR